MTDSEAFFQARFAEAIALHQRGNLSEAEKIYTQILQQQPDHFDALHLLGVLALQTRRTQLGVQLIAKAITVNPNFPPAQVNLGNGYHDLRQFEPALASYRRAVLLDPASANAHLGCANALKELQRPREALAACERAIVLKPDSAEAYLTRGSALMDLGRPLEALASFDKAIALKSGYAEAHLSRGNALTDLGRLQEALACYEGAIALKPDYAQAHCNRGIALADMKRPAEALASHDKAIALKPDYAQAYFGRANALMQMNQPAAAFASYEQAIGLQPDYAEAYSNRGIALMGLKRFGEALASCEKAIALKPDSAEAHLASGIVLTHVKEPAKALESFDRAVALKPDYAQGHSNRAISLIDLKRLQEALASCDTAIALQADYAEAHLGRANALADLKRLDEALASLDKAISLKPDLANAWLSRGTLLKKLERHEQAADAYGQVLELDPQYPFIKGVLLHQKMLCCDWDGMSALVDDIERDIAAGKKSADPFGWQGVSGSQQSLQSCARIYNAERFPARQAAPARFADKKKLRVGYLSGEFRTQATSLLLVGVLEQHDPAQFDIVALDNGWDDRSETRRRIEDAVRIIDIRSLDDDQAAAVIAENDIDILVNLNGYFGEGRTAVFARRPAPIQVNYLGFPGTLGASYMDYIIADRCVIPPSDQQFYDEKVIYLPNSYQANDNRKKIADRSFTRTELGLPEQGFVFCCFNNNYKILPDLFDVWMRILGRTPGSALWLLEDNDTASANLRKEVARRGVDAERLIFARRMAPPDHLARQRCADLFLDTLPYNAHTTASDALWAGLPVLTCRGETFAGRVATSLLNAVGLSELITENLEDYERLAIEIAADPGKLSAIKQKLADNRLTAPLFDTGLFTRRIEAAYRMIYRRHQDRLAPDHIAVSDEQEAAGPAS